MMVAALPAVCVFNKTTGFCAGLAPKMNTRLVLPSHRAARMDGHLMDMKITCSFIDLR